MQDDDINRLRAHRGSQRVTFAEVADHLRDYLESCPDDGAAVERLARFLTDVEKMDHRHENDPERGLC